jgi:hypothetical protein
MTSFLCRLLAQAVVCGNLHHGFSIFFFTYCDQLPLHKGPGMKKIFTAIVAVSLVSAAQAQREISIDSLNNYVGDSVKVCTKIYGGVYPNALLTIVIGAEVRKSFKEAPEAFYKDKEICIAGKIILYKDKPEIVVYDEKQLMLK